MPNPGRHRVAALLLLIALALALPVAARAEVPAARLATLSRGINFTNWFRFPGNQSDAQFRGYIDNATLIELHRVGFTFVRLAVQPELMLNGSGRPDAHRLALLAAAVARIEKQGLGVMVGWHPQTWHIEQSAAEQMQLQELWGALAERLRTLDPAMTFPEIMNEPVFDKAGPAWEALQEKVLARIRAAMPTATVVLTGTNWGSIDGLVALHPVADGNVVYSFHDYETPILTSLGSFEPGLDHAALAHLPFPVEGDNACQAAEESTTQARTRDVIRYYCSEHWDAAKLRSVVDRAAAWGARNHVAVVCGEFGATDQLPASTRLAWIAAMRSALEADRIGWALWGYDDSMGFDIHPDRAPRMPLDPVLLHALGLGGHA